MGNIPAPLFYNVVMDAILCKWYLDGATTGMTNKARFYTDDGELWDPDLPQLQQSLMALEDLFCWMGLLINGSKTKVLTTLPTVATTHISTTVYKHQMEDNGNTYRVRKQLQTICPACDVTMQMQSLKGHYWTQHPNLPLPPMDTPPTLQDPDIRASTPSQHTTNMHLHSAQSQLVASQSMADGSTCAGTSISTTQISKLQSWRKVHCHNAVTVASNVQNHMRFTRLANSVCGDSGATHDACSHNKLSRSDRVHLCSGLATSNSPPLPCLNTWDAGWWPMTAIPWP